MSEHVTISDLVSEAGVSMTTVSRLINNRGETSDVACEHVLEMMERLGYRPSIIARGLATNCTGTLGLAVPDIAPPFFSVSAPGVEDKAHGEGYRIFLCNTKIARSTRLVDDLLSRALSCEPWRRRKEVVE